MKTDRDCWLLPTAIRAKWVWYGCLIKKENNAWTRCQVEHLADAQDEERCLDRCRRWIVFAISPQMCCCSPLQSHSSKLNFGWMCESVKSYLVLRDWWHLPHPFVVFLFFLFRDLFLIDSLLLLLFRRFCRSLHSHLWCSTKVSSTYCKDLMGWILITCRVMLRWRVG